MNYRRYVLPLIPLAVFVFLWQALAAFGLINTGLFSSPGAILTEYSNLYRQEASGGSALLLHFQTTLTRLLEAALLGVGAGIVAGLLMGIRQEIYRFFDPLITLVMPIPGIAMAPLFIIWMGFGDPTIVTVGAIATFFPVVYNTSTGVRSVDRQLVRSAAIMGAGRTATVLSVYLPWSAIYIFTGIKLGLARCWRTVIAVEFIAAADWGLGYMIWDAAEYLRADVVFGGIILLALTFTILEKGVIGSLERITVQRWGMVHH